MPEADKPLVWLHGEVQTPLFSPWRVIYRIDSDAVVIAEATKPQKVGGTDEQEQAGASGRSRLAIPFG